MGRTIDVNVFYGYDSMCIPRRMLAKKWTSAVRNGQHNRTV